MSSIIARAGIVLASALILLSIGCSKERTPGALINPDTGKHPAQWETPVVHGAAAKGAASSTTGFAVCQECHNTAFSGGISNTTCLNTTGCHGAGVNAPHSPAPWRGGIRTHVNTSQSNAPVCAQCHTNGANSSVQPSPFASGTAPGCFNNTLCHAVVGHSAIWENPFYHGAAAKGAPGATTGFSYCQMCHGNNFSGGIALQTCLNTAGCHGANVSAPHSPKPWRGVTMTHIDTDPGNAQVCATCHSNGTNSSVQPSSFDPGAAPGCFNNTLCHAVSHPAGWANPDSHGATAKAAPSTTAGFSFCQSCHGNDFTGGIARQTCLNTTGCHGANVNAPHSPKPWRDGTRTHTTTSPNNALVCALCHTNGANSSVQPSPPAPAGTAVNCFNNTLCHSNVGAPHALPFTDPALHGPPAKADLTNCEACHANPSNGGAGSNPRFNVPKGSLLNGCEDCHAANTAHPVPWRGLTANETGHMTAGNMANVCVLCHGGVTLSGGTGPACTSCHKLGSPLLLTNCTSCHGNPPNGSVYPNAVGKHSQHSALGVYIVCAACHNGGGTGTANHDNGNTSAFVAVLSSYNAKSGAASYNATTNTCSNVSCHGGQTTPGWLSGTVITVNTQCTSCHTSGTAQYNSQNSGQHSTHASQGIACYTCHDTALLAVNHFTRLNTIAMEGPASATLRSQLQYNGTSCNPSAGGLTGCHTSNNW